MDPTERRQGLAFPGLSHRAELPAGVSEREWSLERDQHQNPCIRGLLAALQILDEVLDTSYFLLHCSREQLASTSARVKDVVDILRSSVAPHFDASSVVPDLDAVRRRLRVEYRELEQTDLPLLAAPPSAGQPPQVSLGMAREQLTRSMGKLHHFLQEGFGQLVAADPRSRHEADYFLSRRFARHVVEAEALYGAVFDLQQYLREQGDVGPRGAASVAALLAHGHRGSLHGAWNPVRDFLAEMESSLFPRLRALVVLRGIRFAEAQTLDNYWLSLYQATRIVIELYVARERIQRNLAEQPSPPVAYQSLRIVDDRLGSYLVDFELRYRLLKEFLSRWLAQLEKRRALMLLPPRSESSS
jgi:hypothetical protein